MTQEKLLVRLLYDEDSPPKHLAELLCRVGNTHDIQLSPADEIALRVGYPSAWSISFHGHLEVEQKLEQLIRGGDAYAFV